MTIMWYPGAEPRARHWWPRLRREERGGVWYPPPSFTREEMNISGQPAVPMGTVITSSGTTNTKGSYADLIASTAFDAFQIDIWLSDVAVNTTDTGMLVDLAIGTAGNELDIIPNLLAGHAGSQAAAGPGGYMYRFPLYIPSGSRLSARCQAVQLSDTVRCVVRLLGGPTRPVWAGHQVVAYGPNTADSGAVSVAHGTASEGAWTEITSSTSAHHRWIVAGVGGVAGAMQNGPAALDIGVGASTESAIMSNRYFGANTQETMGHWEVLGGWCDVPAGTRLTARIQKAGAGTDHDVALYGVAA